jgi:hypothetical protein
LFFILNCGCGDALYLFISSIYNDTNPPPFIENPGVPTYCHSFIHVAENKNEENKINKIIINILFFIIYPTSFLKLNMYLPSILYNNYTLNFYKVKLRGMGVIV